MSISVDRAPDPRPARTKAALFAAARELSISDGEFTVNDLVSLAGVSRGSFYTHYGSLDELLGAMLEEMFEVQRMRAATLVAAGRSTQEIVQASVAAVVAYAVRHHAFLRGALGWPVRHQAYLNVVDTFARHHEALLRRMKKDLPAHVEVAGTAQFFAGGTFQVVIRWLSTTEQGARDGQPLDGCTMTEALLRLLPSWYTGLSPTDPLPAGLADDILIGQDATPPR